MKLPRGFAKKYFTLNAIVATVSSVTIHKKSTRKKHANFFTVLNNSSLSPPSESLE
jgi:hypothetical protein